MPNSYDYESIAKMIDHSLLNPSLTTAELEEGCKRRFATTRAV